MTAIASGQRRRTKLIEQFGDAGIDLLLVTDPFNLRWLTGFTGTNGACVLSADRGLFFTDFRYREQVQGQVEGFELCEVEQDLLGSIGGKLRAAGPARLGYDDRNLSVHQRDQLTRELPDKVDLVEAGGLVETLRAIKDSDEVAAIKRAISVADSAFEEVVTADLVGRTEREVAWQLERTMREAGASAVSFPPIVAAADNGALPHAEPRDREIGLNGLVIIDWGCIVDGYCSDCTRTIATGEISGEMKSVYGLVLEAQKAALAQAKAGVEASKVDAAARSIIDQGGYAEAFGHGTGHGVGLQVHEQPRVARSSEAKLLAGNVITVEPGVYLPNKFGVRIEDLVLVQDGRGEVLTTVGKNLRLVQ